MHKGGSNTMGKSDRIKENNAARTLATPAAKRGAKKTMPTWVGTVIVCVVLIALIVGVALSVMNSRGTFKRMHVIARSDNYKITVPMMSYLVYTEYQNLVSTYQQFSSQFGTTIAIPGGTGGDSLDTSTALRDQVYSVTTDEEGNEVTTTWFDHFAELARKDLAQILANCEYARANDIELEKSDLDAIKLALENLDLYASYYGYTTTAYIGMVYGEGVSKNDVRKMMKLTSLSSKCGTVRSAELLAGVSDAEVEAKYNENTGAYDTYIDYLGYSMTADFTPTAVTGDVDADNAKNAELRAEYETLKARYLDIANKLNACTAETFESVLNQELTALFTEEEEKSVLDKKGSGSSLTDEERATCRETAEARVVAAMAEARVTDYNTGDASLGSEIDSWLTGTEDDRRVAGDKKKYTSVYDAYGNETDEAGTPLSSSTSDVYTSASSTYSVYITTSALHHSSGVVRSVGHILFKSETYDGMEEDDIESLAAPLQKLAKRIVKRGEEISAKSMANELIRFMNEEGKIEEKTTESGRTYYAMDESVFTVYGQTYTEDSNVTYDNVAKGNMVEEFENWLFDPARVEGEITYIDEAVQTTYGYHIMLYRGNEQPEWSYNIRKELASGLYDEWLEQVQVDYTVSYNENEKYWNMISA